MFYSDAKNEAIAKLKNKEDQYNALAVRGNDLAIELYELRKSASNSIDLIEKYINSLANVPKEFKKDIASVIMDLKEFHEAMRIENENFSDNIIGATGAVGGTAVGGAIAAMGPTAAMAIATTFGTASTGTAISALSGAAATNAALAWLGGGALAAGGGGMAAGNAFLALAGPVGWAIAGASFIGGGVFATFKNKEAAEEANKLAAEISNKVYVLSPKVEKLEYLRNSTRDLMPSLYLSKFRFFPDDYKKFTDEQKLELSALINNAKSMGVLINERVS